LIVIRPTSQAIVALTFGNYIIKPAFPECSPPPVAVSLLAAVCIGKQCYRYHPSFQGLNNSFEAKVKPYFAIRL